MSNLLIFGGIHSSLSLCFLCRSAATQPKQSVSTPQLLSALYQTLLHLSPKTPLGGCGSVSQVLTSSPLQMLLCIAHSRCSPFDHSSTWILFVHQYCTTTAEPSCSSSRCLVSASVLLPFPKVRISSCRLSAIFLQPHWLCSISIMFTSSHKG